MNPSTPDIELIVREVLAQLRAAPEVPVAKPQAVVGPGTLRAGLGTSVPSKVGSGQSAVGSEAVSGDQPFTLNVAARVVTMNDVAGRLNSVRRVVVSREAIVTPAVRDELLRRGIALESAKSPDGRRAACG